MADIEMRKNTFVKMATDTESVLFPLIAYASFVGLRFDASADPVRVQEVNDYSILDLTTMLGIVALGGEVHGYPCWIELGANVIDTEVPEYVPHRTDDEENVRTWADWHDSTHNHNEIDGKWYVQSNSFGTELDGSILAQLHADEDVDITLHDETSYKALMPTDDPT